MEVLEAEEREERQAADVRVLDLRAEWKLRKGFRTLIDKNSLKILILDKLCIIN